MQPKEDSIWFFRLCACCHAKIERIGGVDPLSAEYFLLSLRQWVGVKIGVSNFSHQTHVQQEFEAPSVKKRRTQSVKALQDKVLE
ncbi:hypothetical protein QUB75_29565 [Microcoleus sp. K1-B6]|uniref:hypothetical protein n=1 Tax=unclassified Microcoleus TaxID=2642155 RepID=UPI002FD4CCC7